MTIVKNRKIFYIVSGVITGASLLCLIIFGLTFGIDFKGGAIFEIDYLADRPEATVVENQIKGAGILGSTIRPTSDKGYLIRTPHLNPESRDSFLGALSQGDPNRFNIKRESSIGPTLGAELK